MQPMHTIAAKTQNRTGQVRPRLYTKTELQEKLGLSAKRIKEIQDTFGIKPVFPDAKRKMFHLYEFQEALNKTIGDHVYKVEKGIAIPSKYKKRESEVRDRMETLKHGDSMLIPEADINNFAANARRMGYKVATRRITSDMFRLWRLDDAQ